MKKLLLAAAALIALATPAMAQVTDEMIAKTAILVTYSKQCRGEIKPEYQRAATDVIAQAKVKFNQMLDTVTTGFSNQGAETFCTRAEITYAKYIDLPSQPGELPACGSSEAVLILKQVLAPIDGVGQTQDMESDNPDKRWCRTKLYIRYRQCFSLAGCYSHLNRWQSFAYTIEWTNKGAGRYWVQVQ